MKTILLILALIFAGCEKADLIQPNSETALSKPTPVTLQISNGRFSGDATYSFDIYATANIPNLSVGNVTIALYIENGQPFSSLKNPDLTYVNPRYTIGAPGYYPMYVEEYENEKKEHGIYLQIVYLQNQGSGNVLGQKEKIATVSCDVEFCVFDLEYDSGNTVFLDTDYNRILTLNRGVLEGCH